MLYAGIYKSNPFTNPTRAGLVATSQVPLVFVVATKNNIVSALTGYGYEKVNAPKTTLSDNRSFWHTPAELDPSLRRAIHRTGGECSRAELVLVYELATAGTWKEDTQHPLIR